MLFFFSGTDLLQDMVVKPVGHGIKLSFDWYALAYTNPVKSHDMASFSATVVNKKVSLDHQQQTPPPCNIKITQSNQNYIVQHKTQ